MPNTLYEPPDLYVSLNCFSASVRHVSARFFLYFYLEVTPDYVRNGLYLFLPLSWPGLAIDNRSSCLLMASRGFCDLPCGKSPSPRALSLYHVLQEAGPTSCGRHYGHRLNHGQITWLECFLACEEVFLHFLTWRRR